MLRFSSIIATLALTFLAALLFVNGCSQNESRQERQQFAKINEGQTTPELAEYMQYMGGYLHKLSLSVRARNPNLTDFYMHELQASALSVKQDVPGYEGYDIAYFMEQLFDAQIDSLRNTVQTRNWEEIEAQINETVKSCNTCHNATGHGFVQVTPGFDKNPYNQVFEPR